MRAVLTSYLGIALRFCPVIRKPMWMRRLSRTSDSMLCGRAVCSSAAACTNPEWEGLAMSFYEARALALEDGFTYLASDRGPTSLVITEFWDDTDWLYQPERRRLVHFG